MELGCVCQSVVRDIIQEEKFVHGYQSSGVRGARLASKTVEETTKQLIQKSM